MNSLVIDEDAFDGLDDDQREVLEKAATQTREWAIERELQPTPRLAKAFCEQGRTRSSWRATADLAALERATAPVTAELERDEQTGELIEAIRDAEADVAVSAAPTGALRRHGAGSTRRRLAKLDGVYRFEITDEHLRKAGVTTRPRSPRTTA